MKKCLLGFYFIFFVFDFGYCQNPLVKMWDKRFGGTGYDLLYAFQQTADKGYILGGFSYSGIGGDKTQANWDTINPITQDFWIVKTDSVGNKQWDKNFGGINEDDLYSLQQTDDGGYILGGYSYSGISGDKTQAAWGYADYWILKTDSSGNKQWDKGFGGTGIDRLYSLQQTTDGGYILGGYSYSDVSGDKTFGNWDTSGATPDYWIVKTDSLGNKQWDRVFGGSGDDQLHALKQTKDGGYIFGGRSNSSISGNKTQDTVGGWDYWIVKTDSFGNILWDNVFGGTDVDRLYSLQQTADVGYILAGYSFSDSSGDKTQDLWGVTGDPDYWIIKADSLGNKQWDKDFGGIVGEDEFGNVFQTSDGGFLFAGTSYSDISGDKTENNLGTEQTWVVKTDSLGNKLWDKTLRTNSSQHDEIGFAIQAKDGCYVMANYTDAGTGGDKTQSSWGTSDYWIIKFCDTTATTGISNLQIANTNVQIFPNPTTESVSINFNQPANENWQLAVYDLFGRKVLNSTIESRKLTITIDISDFKNGVYIVELNAGTNFYRTKIVKM